MLSENEFENVLDSMNYDAYAGYDARWDEKFELLKTCYAEAVQRIKVLEMALEPNSRSEKTVVDVCSQASGAIDIPSWCSYDTKTGYCEGNQCDCYSKYFIEQAEQEIKDAHHP